MASRARAFHAGLRRSEAAGLRWGDVEPAASIPGALTIRVRTSKTNRDGEATDVRLAKNGAAAALTALRPANASPTALVFRGLNGQSIGRRFAAAANAAGVEGVTAHSGRVGLASELTAAGASTTETMLAGGCFKEAALYIAERIHAPPPERIATLDGFEKTVVHECDHWIKAIGEPELGSHYTAPMRINFLKIMQSALRKAFERPEPDPIENPPLEDLKSLLDDNKIVIFDLNFDLPTRHPSYANAVARMKKRRVRKPE